jgi:hypothetical protein
VFGLAAGSTSAIREPETPHPYPAGESVVKDTICQVTGVEVAAEAGSAFLQAVEEGPAPPQADPAEPALQPELVRQGYLASRARLLVRWRAYPALRPAPSQAVMCRKVGASSEYARSCSPGTSGP